jgi:hypothetical protein
MTSKRVQFPPVDLDDLREGFAHLDNEREFWQRHKAEYVDRYPDEFVAVALDGGVIGHSPDLVEFAGQLNKSGLGPRDRFTTFLEKTPVRYIL